MDTSKRKDEKKENTNTISNLPLLFANGYPTSLEKITETQLVKFIPFMVQCSLGNVQNQGSATVHDAIETLAESTPAWWPDDIPFDLPLVQPVAISTVRATPPLPFLFTNFNLLFSLSLLGGLDQETQGTGVYVL